MIADMPTWPRLYRYALQVAKRNRFMPALRIFSTVGYYSRFIRLLAESSAQTGFIASHYSPEALGFAAACHKSERLVLFTNHANATNSQRYVPPVYADLLALTSTAVADTIIGASAKTLNIIPIPIDTPYSPLRIPNSSDHYTVGIYLTALTNQEHLSQLIATVYNHLQIKALFVRLHPAQIVNADLSELVERHPELVFSQGAPLLDDIHRTDIAICGNSTVAIELLRSGRPVLYDDQLDYLTKDYNGYYAKGLVPMCEQGKDGDFLKELQLHYSQESWASRMRYFDYGYKATDSQLQDEFCNTVKSLLSHSSENTAHED